MADDVTIGSSPSGGGHTAKDPSGWSLDTLKDYFERLFHEYDRRLEQRFIAQEKAVTAALDAAKEATDKYEADVERWRIANNEWRQAMLDRENKFVTTDTFDTQIKGWNQRFDDLDKKIDDLTRSRDVSAGRQHAITALIGLGFAAVTVALRFVGT